LFPKSLTTTGGYGPSPSLSEPRLYQIKWFSR